MSISNRLRLTGACLCAGLVLGTTAEAGSLGRLFFTPEERAQLESGRAKHLQAAATRSTASAEEKSIAAPAEENEAPAALTVNGIVQKRGGSRTVWVNGVAQDAGNSDERAPESLAVAVPGKTQPVRVKVGQSLLLPPQPQRKPPEQKTPEQKPTEQKPTAQKLATPPASDDD